MDENAVSNREAWYKFSRRGTIRVLEIIAAIAGIISAGCAIWELGR